MAEETKECLGSECFEDMTVQMVEHADRTEAYDLFASSCPNVHANSAHHIKLKKLLTGLWGTWQAWEGLRQQKQKDESFMNQDLKDDFMTPACEAKLPGKGVCEPFGDQAFFDTCSKIAASGVLTPSDECC